MATPIQTIKNWFLTGLKPTQAQFHAWMDSFWHKDERIPTDRIEGLEAILNNIPNNANLDNKVDKIPNHSLLSDAEIARLLTLQNQDFSSKADLVDGKVPASQLPSYIDDVVDGQYINETTFNNVPTGLPYELEDGKIYVDVITNITYRWSGTLLIPIGSSLGLGETETTAYRGDRGKFSFDFVTNFVNSGLQALANGILKVKIAWFGGFTIAQRNAIATPTEGMLIYVNEAPKGFQVYENGAWRSVGVNISNTDLTNLTVRTFTQNAQFTWATLGNNYNITGLATSVTPDKALVLNTSKNLREVKIINLSETWTGVTYPTNQNLLDTYPLAEIVKCPNTPQIREYHRLGVSWFYFILTPA